MINWWEGAAGALLGATIGSCIPLGWSWWRRRIERRGEITAMYAERYRAFLCLRALINDGVMAPLYRLPIAMTEQALPKFIGDGSLDGNEVYALVEYINRIEELNRGLDRAGEAHATDNAAGLQTEYQRNVAKATEILDEKLPRHADRTLFEAVGDVLFDLSPEDGPYMRKSLTVPTALRRFWPKWSALTADWATAIFTGLLVIVGLLTAIVLFRQMKEMTAATVATESAAKAALTQADAFIGIESPVIVLADEGGGIELIDAGSVETGRKITEGAVPEHSTINIVVRNVGRSAGTITGVDYQWSFGAGPPAESTEYKSSKVELTLAPGAEHTFNLHDPIEATGENLASMRHGSTLHVQGSINYLDLLGKPLKRRFKVYWNQSRGFVS